MPKSVARACVAILLVAGFGTGLQPVHADSPGAVPEMLTVEKAVAWALSHSPELALARKQRGIAEANVVIAHTYPFNPIWFNLSTGDGGPESAGITNRFFTENYVRLDLELCGQGEYRRAAAAAAVSRVEWEIAAQELAVAVRVLRAFNTFVYRQEKRQLRDDTITLQEQTVEQVRLLANQGRLKPAERMLAESDLLEARAQRGPAQTLVVTAWNDLRRAMGVDVDVVSYRGGLEPGSAVDDVDGMTRAALETRPDLRALQLAIVEADERLHLEIANRFGNPSVGPIMEYNETRVLFVGAVLQYSLPVFNTRRGDIQLRQAERERVIADRRRAETQAALDVHAALARMKEARQWADYLATESLPALQKTTESFEKLFALGEPGVDALRLIDVRRRLLRARDSYLDALWELSQARADLAAAVGDLDLALGSTAAPECSEAPAKLLPPVSQAD
jgi:cobalt-zinc-cadmium efflux system outer membrane protein